MRPFKSLLLILSALSVSLSLQAEEAPLATVEKVDLDRYLGKWYEIARFEQSFQKGCYNTTADYSMREDGDIKVLNSCDKEGQKERKEGVGRAWATESSNAKLRVQFFLRSIKLKFLSGRYWILALGDKYDYALVGDPSREYLWILSRTPEMDKGLEDMLVQKAQSLGFDTSKLLYNDDLKPK